MKANGGGRTGWNTFKDPFEEMAQFDLSNDSLEHRFSSQVYCDLTPPVLCNCIFPGVLIKNNQRKLLNINLPEGNELDCCQSIVCFPKTLKEKLGKEIFIKGFGSARLFLEIS